MVKLLTIMGWNVENFGKSKYTTHGTQLARFIAHVINHNKVDIAAFSEMRSNLGGAIGQKIAAELNKLQAGANWTSHPSNQFVPQRLEQYLFLWKNSVVTTYNSANGTPYQWLYDDPANPAKKIGFPKQISKDRPPFLGYFQKTDSTGAVRRVLVAVMHSPGPGFWKNTRDAAKNMARVTEFRTLGSTCVIVGDFNIKYQTDASVANSNGEAGFGDLVGAHFDQAMNPIDAATSLIDAVTWTTPMALGDYQNQPYDQVFFRTTGAAGAAALNYQPAFTDDLIEECINGKYLEKPLGEIVDAYTGNSAKTTYGADINKAFVDYRLYVSDHLPVLIQVDE